MKKVIKILTLILAISAAYQAVIVYAAGGKCYETITSDPPGP